MKKKTKNISKRAITLLLAMVLALSLVIPTSMADSESNDEDSIAETINVGSDTEQVDDSEDSALSITIDDNADITSGIEEEEEIQNEIVPLKPVSMFTSTDSGVSVSVITPYGSILDDAELSVSILDKDDAEYTESADAVGDTGRNLDVIDISFICDGEEVEPTEPVSVSIDASEIIPADAFNIVIQHLTETDSGIIPEVVAEAENSSTIMEFEVTSFSKFTIEWNDNTDMSIEVHVYNMNGIGIEEVLDTTYTHNGGDILISDLVDHLAQNEEYATTYTFQYAAVYYEIESENDRGPGDTGPGTSGPGNESGGEGYTVIVDGSEENSLTELSKVTTLNGDETSTTYTVIFANGTTDTITDPYNINIHLYYSIPVVSIAVDGEEHGNTINLVTSDRYFQGMEASDSNVEYTWVLSDNSLADIVNNNDGTAVFTWNTENAAAGSHVDVIVTMTNTYTNENGNVLTEIASDTYTLIYGQQDVIVSVSNIPVHESQQGGGPQATTVTVYGVAYIAFVDENGVTVATAEINNGTTEGTVDVWLAPGTYTVGVTGICGDSQGPSYTVRNSGDATIVVTENGGSVSVALGETVTSGSSADGVTGSYYETGKWGDDVYYYEHIDVKIAVAETEDVHETFSDLDSVYVYDKYGSLIFQSKDLIANEGTFDYNCKFDVGNAEDIHSLAVSSEDTIVIVYEVIDDDTGATYTYTATINGPSVYGEGEYYDYSFVNAYQLYNCIYGTDYSEEDFLAMVADETLPYYNENGVDVSGLTHIQVADYLCDTRTDDAGRNAGLDFVIDVMALDATDIDLHVAKSYTGVPEDEAIDENTVFSFDLIELDEKDIATGQMTWETENVLDYSTGSTGAWTKVNNDSDDGTVDWTSIINFDRSFEYESEYGTNFYYYILRETEYGSTDPVSAYYGIIANVTFENALPSISVSYAQLERIDDEGKYGTYQVVENTYRNLDLTYVKDSNGNVIDSYYALPFENEYVAPIDIPVQKIWDDNNDQDGRRPDSVYVVLTALIDDDEISALSTLFTREVTLSEDNDWSYVFEGLPVSNNGNKIIYELEEFFDSDEYETEITFSDEDGFTVTNTHEPYTTEIPVWKIWSDDDDRDGLRPEGITVTLFGSDGTYRTANLTEKNSWYYLFENLPVYCDHGTPIDYNLTEVAVNGYHTSISTITTGETPDIGEPTISTQFVITNSHNPETTDIVVTKVWDDNNDQDGVRPDNVWVILTADDGNHDVYILSTIFELDAELTAENNWSYTFEGLPVYSNGQKIDYEVTEVYLVDEDGNINNSYTSSIQKSADGYTFTVTNTHIPETTEITVYKEWDDDENRDGIRPTRISVTLMGSDNSSYNWAITDTTADEDGIWSHTFKNLPVYWNHGEKIEYIIDEASVFGYEQTFGVLEGPDDDGNYSFTLTNSHTPETINLTGTKIWDDDDNRDGIRPEEVTVILCDAEGNPVDKNGKPVDEGNEITTTATAQNDWTWEFNGLTEYHDGGEEIVYTVSEVSVDGYTTSIDGNKITNSHTPETINIPVIKIWDDSNNQDGVRPSSIEVLLYGSDSSSYLGELTADSEWQYTFTNLPKYWNEGTEIEYTLIEISSDIYMHEVVNVGENGIYSFEVTNTYVPTTINIPVVKIWDDDDNRDGVRPESITVILTGTDGTEETAVLDENNNWVYLFEGLSKYYNEGTEIKYTLTEETTDKYEVTIESFLEGYGFYVTNTHKPETTEVTVNKTWDDNDNQDGLRPTYVIIMLEGSDDSTHWANIRATDGWTYTFSNLPKYDNGEEIEYTVSEFPVEGYGNTITYDNDEDAYIITNTHNPETTGISIVKVWDDDNNRDGLRPEDGITFTLYADGKKVESNTVTASDGWSWHISDLPVYDNGEKIEYSIAEDKVTGYEDAVIAESADGYSFTITNTHEPEVTSVTISKAWDDDNDRDGIRPTHLTVMLMGSDNQSYIATLSDSNNWTYTFTNLPVYWNNGEKIVYTADEFSVSNYAESVTNNGDYTFSLTNSHTPETTSVSGTKTWVDADNQDGIRSSEITVNLYADGDYIDSKTVTAADGWYYTFDNLTKYRDGGVEIVYTVTEDSVDEYTGTVSGTNIINNHTPYTINIPVQKVWNDNDDQDGIRTKTITVYLSGSDGNIYVADLTAENNWTYVFEDLPLRHNGVDITYSLHEAEVDGYTAEVIKGTDGHSFTVTNTYIPAVIDIPVAKVWDDNENQDGIRPNSISVTLTGSDGNTYTTELTKDNGYMAMFTDLPVYFNHGTLIDYTLTEKAVDEYEGTVAKDDSGYAFTVENSHEPYTTEVTVEKTWDDDSNRDGIRPNSVDVTLTGSDGNIYTATLTADDGWTYTFTDLPVNYAEGTTIVYELTEASVDGYTASINKSADGYAFAVENTHEPALRDIPVTKVWADNDDELGYRPDEIEVALTGIADGETVYEKTVTLTEEDDWAYLFENLFVYENGQTITYTVSETPVIDYYTDINGSMRNGYEITNTVIAPKLDKELVEDDYARKEADGTTMHDGEDTDGNGWGIWDDADNNQDVTFKLTLTDIKSAVNLTVHDYLDNGLDFELDTVEITLYDGEDEIVLENDVDYTVSEGECTDPDCTMDGCTFEISFVDEVFDGVSPDAYIIVTYKALTDTHADDYIDYVDKIYNEAYILYGVSGMNHRSAVVITETDLFGFEAYKYVNEDGELVGLEGAEFILSHDDTYGVFEIEEGTDSDVYYILTGWTSDIENAGIITSGSDGMIRVEGLDDDTYMLTETVAPVGYYELEEPVTFTIDEDGTVTGDTVMADDDYTVVGIENEKILTSVTGTKTWVDNDDQDGIRPDGITIRLYANGEEVGSMLITAEDDWIYTFSDLVAYNDGIEIEYTITEDEVDGYVTEYNDYDVVNTHEPETTSIDVVKVWNDEDNADGIRPGRVTVILTADGQMTGYYLELTEENDWTGTFENLDVYADGNAIEYGLYELDVDGYTSEATGNAEDGFTVTNTHEVTVEGPGPVDNPDDGGTTGTDKTEPDTDKTEPDNGGKSGNQTGNVKTGEIIGISSAGIVALGAIAGAVITTVTRKRKENED